MRQTGHLLDGLRGISEACVTRPLVKDWIEISLNSDIVLLDSSFANHTKSHPSEFLCLTL